MEKEIHTFWESVTDYDKQIASVFNINNNILIEYLSKIKSKKKKTIADIGCGPGNSFKHLKEFKKVYAFDFSKKLLEVANKTKSKNIEIFQDNIIKYKLPENVDISLAVMSIFPNNYGEFDEIITNILNNTKKNGEIILVLHSFESRTFSFHLDSDLYFKKSLNPNEIITQINNQIQFCNYHPFGYLKINSGIIQKYWLKEEIKFRLLKYNFKKINIEKLELDWEKQLHLKEYKNYPKLWFWFIKIKK